MIPCPVRAGGPGAAVGAQPWARSCGRAARGRATVGALPWARCRGRAAVGALLLRCSVRLPRVCVRGYLAGVVQRCVVPGRARARARPVTSPPWPNAAGARPSAPSTSKTWERARRERLATSWPERARRERLAKRAGQQQDQVRIRRSAQANQTTPSRA